MKRANLLLVVLAAAVAAGCSGTSKGIEVENPTPEITTPTAYRNIDVGVEIAPPAGWSYTESSALQVEFRPLREGITASAAFTFIERLAAEEGLEDIIDSASPGLSFSPLTVGEFDACLGSKTSASELRQVISCDLGGYFMLVEYRSSPIVGDIAGLFTIRSIASGGSGALHNGEQQGAGAEVVTKSATKPDCAANPDSPGCMKNGESDWEGINEDGTCGGGDLKDNDCDGLTNKQEKKLGSNPNDPDSDGDGILDGDELPGCITTSKPPEVCAIVPE